MSNVLRVIAPYRWEGMWVFDDERAGLVREPFVSGIPEMIDTIVAQLPNSEQGFRLIFSDRPFPGYQMRLDWLREDLGGNWYRWVEREMEGWLCPALFKYFEHAPATLFARAEPKPAPAAI